MSSNHPQEANTELQEANTEALEIYHPSPGEYHDTFTGSMPLQENITHHFFSQRLKHIMTKRNISSVELARLLFVSNSTISGYRLGRRLPDLERLRLICIDLSVSADYLLGLKDSPQIDKSAISSSSSE